MTEHTKIGDVIRIGDSYGITIPSSLVQYLKITSDVKAKKTWNPETNTWEIQFVRLEAKPLMTEKLNSCERDVIERWKRDNL